jgi:hypothetical protein
MKKEIDKMQKGATRHFLVYEMHHVGGKFSSPKHEKEMS